jgi:hypothetical protein
MKAEIVPIDQPLVLTVKQWKRHCRHVGLNKKRIPDERERLSAKCSEASKYGIRIAYIELSL